MKKVISKGMALMLVLSTMLVGCASGANENEPVTKEASETEAAAKTEVTEESSTSPSAGVAFKVGTVDTGSGDATQQPLLDQLELTVEALGGEVVYATVEASADSYIAAVENLISKGCDALILNNRITLYGLLQQTENMCSSAGVYYSLYWTNIIEGSEDYNIAMNSDWFVSTTFEDDVDSAYYAASKLGEAGCKKIATITLPLGSTAQIMRDEGITKACEEYGMEVVGTESDTALTLTSSGGNDIVTRFLSAYPELDGICIAGMTQMVLPGVVQALESADKVGEIKVVGIDFNEYQTTYMEQDALQAIIGGHFAGPSYSAILIANILNGTPLMDEPVILQDQFIKLGSLEEAKNYDENVYNGTLYTAEEITNCLLLNNPDFTYENLKTMADSYSLDDIMTRHAK